MTETHTTILTVTGRKKYAVEAVVEGAQTAHKFAKKHDKSLKLEVRMKIDSIEKKEVGS